MKALSTSKLNRLDAGTKWIVVNGLFILTIWLAGCTTTVPTPDPTATIAAPTATSKATHEIALAEPIMTTTPAATLAPAPTPVATKLPTQPAPIDDLGSLMNVTPAPTSIPLPPLPERLDYELTLVNQLGGQATAMAINGELAYVAVGPRLVVVDLSDPTAPQEIGRSEMLPAPIQLMAVDGTDAFVVMEGEKGLYQLDLMTPQAPAIVTSITLPADALALGERQFVELVVAGDSIYLGETQWVGGERGSALHRLDRPITLGAPWSTPTVIEGTFAGLVLLPGYLYLLTYDQLLVLQLSADGNPVIVAEYDNEFAAHDGLVIDDLLYLMGWQMTVMDIANPSEPQQRQNLWANPYASVRGLIVSEDRFLAASFGGDVVSSSALSSLDTGGAATTEWQVIQRWRENEQAMDLQLAGSTAVLLTDHGLYLFDMPQYGEPSLIGRWVATGELAQALPVGHQLIVGSFTGDHPGVWDISDPAQPGLVREISGIDWGGPMSVAGSRLSIPSIYGYMTEHDLSSGISFTAGVGPPLVGLTIQQTQDYYFAYAYGYGRLIVVDHQEMTLVAVLDDPELRPWHSVLIDDGLFIAMSNGQLLLYDIKEGLASAESQPGSFSYAQGVIWPPVTALPLTTWDHRLDQWSARIALHGHYIYALQQLCKDSECPGVLKVIDIAEPLTPVVVAAYELNDTHGSVRQLVVADDQLILVGQELIICDLTEPEAPAVVARLTLPAVPVMVHKQQDYLYVSARQWGLFVLRIHPT